MKVFSRRDLQAAAALSCLARSFFSRTSRRRPRPVRSSANRNPPQQPQRASNSNGQVIFSRSTDENGQTRPQAGPGAQRRSRPVEPVRRTRPPPATPSARPSPSPTSIWTCICAPRNRTSPSAPLITVRNDGKSPLAHIPLAISSSLNWERIRVAGNDVAFTVATLNSDTDHTGQLHEAAVTLAQPLAPGASLQLDVTYSGASLPIAQRLLAIGTPDDVALHSDWDGIGAAFHRPARLRQRGVVSGLERSRHSGRWRAGLRRDGRAQAAPGRRAFPPAAYGRVSARPAPTVALINGHPAPLTVTDARPDHAGRTDCRSPASPRPASRRNPRL